MGLPDSFLRSIFPCVIYTFKYKYTSIQIGAVVEKQKWRTSLLLEQNFSEWEFHTTVKEFVKHDRKAFVFLTFFYNYIISPLPVSESSLSLLLHPQFVDQQTTKSKFVKLSPIPGSSRLILVHTVSPLTVGAIQAPENRPQEVIFGKIEPCWGFGQQQSAESGAQSCCLGVAAFHRKELPFTCPPLGEAAPATTMDPIYFTIVNVQWPLTRKLCGGEFSSKETNFPYSCHPLDFSRRLSFKIGLKQRRSKWTVVQPNKLVQVRTQSGFANLRSSVDNKAGWELQMLTCSHMFWQLENFFSGFCV